jgi:hypothetical protein
MSKTKLKRAGSCEVNGLLSRFSTRFNVMHIYYIIMNNTNTQTCNLSIHTTDKTDIEPAKTEYVTIKENV